MLEKCLPMQVCTTEEDTLFWRTILAAQMTVTEVPELPGQAAMLTGLSTQQVPLLQRHSSAKGIAF